jgi:hypothetical protein
MTSSSMMNMSGHSPMSSNWSNPSTPNSVTDSAPSSGYESQGIAIPNRIQMLQQQQQQSQKLTGGGHKFPQQFRGGAGSNRSPVPNGMERGRPGGFQHHGGRPGFPHGASGPMGRAGAAGSGGNYWSNPYRNQQHSYGDEGMTPGGKFAHQNHHTVPQLRDRLHQHQINHHMSALDQLALERGGLIPHTSQQQQQRIFEEILQAEYAGIIHNMQQGHLASKFPPGVPPHLIPHLAASEAGMDFIPPFDPYMCRMPPSFFGGDMVFDMPPPFFGMPHFFPGFKQHR